MESTETSQIRIDAQRFAHDYAWNWFSYHAGQRVALFNISLVAIAAAVAGTVSATTQDWHPAAALSSLVGALFAFAFLRLDQRNSELTKLAETHLQESELLLSKYVGDTIKLATSANKPAMPTFYTFGQISKRLYKTCIVAGLAAAVYYSIRAII